MFSSHDFLMKPPIARVRFGQKRILIGFLSLWIDLRQRQTNQNISLGDASVPLVQSPDNLFIWISCLLRDLIAHTGKT